MIRFAMVRSAEMTRVVPKQVWTGSPQNRIHRALRESAELTAFSNMAAPMKQINGLVFRVKCVFLTNNS